MEPAVGLDFGTTNSAIGWLGSDGAPVLASFSAAEEERTFRSVLYFDRGEDGSGPLGVRAGPEAIARYLAAEENRHVLDRNLHVGNDPALTGLRRRRPAVAKEFAWTMRTLHVPQ